MSVQLVTATRFERFAEVMAREGFIRILDGEYAKPSGDGYQREFIRSARLQEQLVRRLEALNR